MIDGVHFPLSNDRRAHSRSHLTLKFRKSEVKKNRKTKIKLRQRLGSMATIGQTHESLLFAAIFTLDFSILI